MAHFAELDENNVVKRVIVVANQEITDANGVETESVGIAFCQQLFGGVWLQTSYNGNIRKQFAGIGYTYNPALDAFIAPQPAPECDLDPETAMWICPPMASASDFSQPVKSSSETLPPDEAP